MTPQEWQAVKELLGETLNIEPGERKAYLDRSCKGDDFLRREVEQLLLEAREIHPGFLTGASLVSTVSAVLGEGDNPWIGRRLGSYRIVQQIGSGGMGEVYRARRDDDEFEKDVALKLVRAERDSAFVISRFKTERQILAGLEHRNIAKLLDGGTSEEGLPYIVMELIEGEPITRYCDAHALGIADRLELFLQVCSAVQYAHQRLIIHRDIKPGNILVTAEGVPKLLDFGIAKILDLSSPFNARDTTTMFRAMTPQYASPEQINGDSMTTASDVYSLGVVLYELLSGRSPYRMAGGMTQSIASAVRDAEPQRPSLAVFRSPESADTEIPLSGIEELASFRDSRPGKLAKRLRGDLDNVVLMALRKEPHRRYASVEQLAGDISHHLKSLPVTASRGSARYRTTKFIVRHKASVVAAAAIAATLLIGMVVIFHEARVAGAERKRAEQRFRDMRELARSNLFEFHDAIKDLPGSAGAQNLVIQRALGYLDKLSQSEAGDPDLMEELAEGYAKVGNLQGNFSNTGIGDSAAALADFKKSYDIRESLISSSGGAPKHLKAECDLLYIYIIALQENGKTQEASVLAHHGIGVAERLSAKQPGDREALFDRAYAHINIGRVMGGNGSSGSTRELSDAIFHEREAITLLSQQPGVHDRVWLQVMLGAQLTLAYHLRKNREFEASLKTYDALWSMTEAFKGFPQPLKALAYNHRSRLFHDMGDFQHALSDGQITLANAQSASRADPHDLNASILVALANGTIGVDEAQLRRKNSGRERLDKAIADAEHLLSMNPHQHYYEALLVLGHSFQGKISSSVGKQEDAYAKYSQALAMAAELAQKDPSDLESRLNIAKIHVDLGVVMAREKKTSESRQETAAGISQLDALLRLRPRDCEILYTSELAHSNLVHLEGCTDEHECQGTRSMRVSEPNN